MYNKYTISFIFVNTFYPFLLWGQAIGILYFLFAFLIKAPLIISILSLSCRSLRSLSSNLTTARLIVIGLRPKCPATSFTN